MPMRRGSARTSPGWRLTGRTVRRPSQPRSEEHTSELQSLRHLVCRLLLEKKKEQTLTANDGWGDLGVVQQGQAVSDSFLVAREFCFHLTAHPIMKVVMLVGLAIRGRGLY